ncbi:MAG TPA: hypothetical protein PK584_05045 [Fervidobacterium sp.]|nr:hypothetical protein [Fervidobacterium sp.]
MRVCIVPNDIELRNQLSNSLIVIWTIKKADDTEADVCAKQDLMDKHYDLDSLNFEEFDYTPTEESA